MKGIRESVLSKEVPESDLADAPFDSDRYDESYYEGRHAPYRGQRSLFEGSRKTEVAGELQISVTISNELLDGLADEDSPNYDQDKASDLAEELAWEELTKLAGADLAARYSHKTEVEEDWDEIEVTITLNPLTS